MGRKKLGIKEKRAKAIEKEIKQLEKKGYDVLLATEGKSIEELSRSKQSYERFKKRKQVAKERKKIEAEIKQIKIRFAESKRKYTEKRKRIIKEQEEKRRLREEEKKREEKKKRKEQEKPVDFGYKQEKFGLDEEEEFKMKEYLTNMLTERMDDVDKELVDKVKNIIYKADIVQLDRISDFFPDWDVFKEFYTYNDEDVYGSRNAAEKTEVLKELIRYMGE